MTAAPLARVIRCFAAGLLLLLAGSAWSQEFQRIQSRWKQDQYLHVEHGRLQASRIDPGWWSAMWIIEPVQGTPFVRLRNRWKPEEYLNIERGRLEAGPIERGWWSAMWTLEPADAGASRIHSRWKNEQYINIEHGRPESGPIERGWWSAMWYFQQP